MQCERKHNLYITRVRSQWLCQEFWWLTTSKKERIQKKKVKGMKKTEPHPPVNITIEKWCLTLFHDGTLKEKVPKSQRRSPLWRHTVLLSGSKNTILLMHLILLPINPLLITYIQNLLSYGITFLYFTYDQKILFLFY